MWERDCGEHGAGGGLSLLADAAVVGAGSVAGCGCWVCDGWLTLDINDYHYGLYLGGCVLVCLCVCLCSSGWMHERVSEWLWRRRGCER